MFGILLAIGIVILIAILLLIYRIYTLVSVVRGADKIRVSTSNKVNGILFLVFLIVFGGWFFYYSFAAYDSYQLPLASEHGDRYEQLFWATTWVTVAVFVLTHIALFVFSFKYQYKEGRKAAFYPDNTKLEIIWTIIPAIVLTILVFGGFRVWTDITGESPEDPEVLELMGYQFAWEARYTGPDGKLGDFDYRNISALNQMGIDFSDESAYDDFIARDIYLPKGKPVEIKIRARDVIHSVYLPHFRQKMDAVPGMPTRMWFVPTKTTAEMREELNNPDFNYELACAEVCGRGHFSMRKTVVVLEPEEYARWYAEQESILKMNPELLSSVPAEQRKLANIKAGVKTDLKEEAGSVELSQK
jgi:cytochrome c oxidase subunit 2